MIAVERQILVRASVDFVFAKALDVDVHVACERAAGERAIDSPASRILALGDSVTFEAVHLGVRRRLTSKVVEYDRPARFVDEMQRGAFKFLRHTHTFEASDGGTLIRDRLELAAPFGQLGALSEVLFLRRTMERFLERHQRAFRNVVEQG